MPTTACPNDAEPLDATLADHGPVQGHRSVADDASVRLILVGTPVVETDRSALAGPGESALPDAMGE